MTHIPAPLGDIFENHIPAGKTDSKGRQIGYIVGLRDNGTDFYAWVQNARVVNGEFVEFGVAQRSKKFASQAAATSWAYSTARERIAKVGAAA